ncbi:helix-turn-helix domain-containing protein [Anaerostipes faecalis]|uniref:helix-turn-helix domain-containing protein n=1 Tax=Anaerostipes faecalis TaxID=2738446 RepID=UPI003F031E18
MSKRTTYPNIDLQRTGQKMKHMLESAGYTPRMLQDYLHLSCVQPIYRWYKGLILPSVDHLFMLSELLGVHMEDFLVKKNAVPVIYDIEQHFSQTAKKRYIAYYKKIYQPVA